LFDAVIRQLRIGHAADIIFPENSRFEHSR
jgi:hypothetical protein